MGIRLYYLKRHILPGHLIGNNCMNFKRLFIITAVVALFASCKKEDQVVNVGAGHSGTVVLRFENFAGEEPLSLKAGAYAYKNAGGDSFGVSAYKYYISNVRFVNTQGVEYLEPGSYYLIDQSDTSSFSRTLSNIPAGDYTTVKVLLGVDSTHNVSGAQAGDLDPMYGMFWTWSSGYIMAKAEGSFKKTDGAGAGMSFHLGGFSGAYSVLREVSIGLPQTLVVAHGSSSAVFFKSDILKWFDGPVTIDFQQLNQVGAAGADAAKIADNYSNSLSVTHVEN